MLRERHTLCLLHNYENVTKMELFGELQASLLGFAQGSNWTDCGKMWAGSLLHL